MSKPYSYEDITAIQQFAKDVLSAVRSIHFDKGSITALEVIRIMLDHEQAAVNEFSEHCPVGLFEKGGTN